MSEPRLQRIENSYDGTPRCPVCHKETRVRPVHAKGGGIVAIVECRFCDYTGEFFPTNSEEPATLDGLKDAVLTSLEDGPASVDELVGSIGLTNNRKQVRRAVRHLFKEGHITETPDWKYRKVERMRTSRCDG